MLDPFHSCRELRCLRNTIHCNLFFTYIFSALLWLMTLSFQVSVIRPVHRWNSIFSSSPQMSSSAGLIECMALLVLLHFFNLTNFFWMMIEGNQVNQNCRMKMNELSRISIGLYLYLLVVETFSRIEVINKFGIYAVIGYGESPTILNERNFLTIQSVRNEK